MNIINLEGGGFSPKAPPLDPPLKVEGKLYSLGTKFEYVTYVDSVPHARKKIGGKWETMRHA